MRPAAKKQYPWRRLKQGHRSLKSRIPLVQNKKERKKVREVGILKEDPEALREQIEKLEMMKADGALDKARKQKKRQLEDTLNLVMKKRKALYGHGVGLPPRFQLCYGISSCTSPIYVGPTGISSMDVAGYAEEKSF